MANPQVENGYTKIANELLEAFGRTRIRSEIRRVVDVVIRQTYGFNKVCDHISLSQFELKTGMKRGSVCRALKEGVAMLILSKTENGYKLNKNYTQWGSRNVATGGSQKSHLGGRNSANLVVATLRHTKETITKEITKGNFKKLDKLKENLTSKKIIK